MKRIGGLFDLIPQRENLARAAWAAAQGKRDRPEVRAFFADLDARLAHISHALRSGTFAFSGYRSFAVRDTKSRTIHAPAFADRVVHHAIIGITGPVFEKGALEHSYACRRGRGQHAALRQAAAWTRRADHFGKIDVRKFYDSIRHDVLFRLLERRFREQRLLDLFAALLASYTHLPGQGLPIGALTSQYLGNFMLDRLDQGINRQEQRLPSLRVPRHGDAASPDDAPSRALPPAGRDETTGKTPPHPDTQCGAWRNGCGGAPTQPSPSHD